MSKHEIKVNINSDSTHRGVERSTTLNRRYVKRPTKIMIEDVATEEIKEAIEIIKDSEFESEIEVSPEISHVNMSMPDEAVEEVSVEMPEIEEVPDLPPAPNPYQEALDRKKAEQDRKMVEEISSRALKEAAIEKALSEMKEPEPISKKEAREEKALEKVMKKEMEAGETGKKAEKLEKLSKKQAKKLAKREEKVTRHIKKGHKGRVVLAFATSAVCMLALGFLVKVNLPHISVSVAAAQTGVEASYPSYTPRDFTLSGVYADKESVIIDFTGPNDTSFSLSEEKTAWDSSALISNYVKSAYGADYETVNEGGTTIYIKHSNATWIKNNTLYKLTAVAGTLTKRQIKNIVTSL